MIISSCGGNQNRYDGKGECLIKCAEGFMKSSYGYVLNMFEWFIQNSYLQRLKNSIMHSQYEESKFFVNIFFFQGFKF